MDNGKVVAWKSRLGGLDSGWKSGSPSDRLLEGLRQMGCTIELAYSAAAVMELVEALEGVMSLPMTEYPKALLPALVAAGKALATYREKADE